MGNLRTDQKLLDNIKRDLPHLKELLERMNEEWGLEDGVYRFYHRSFKVYRLQWYTEQIVWSLARLDPREEDERLFPRNWGDADSVLSTYSPLFEDIVLAGTGIKFKMAYNWDWAKYAAPIVGAAFHTHYILTMLVKYGEELDKAPMILPSGWAAVLSVFQIR